MQTPPIRVSDILVEVVAGVMVAGILGIVAQFFGLFRRMTKVEHAVKDLTRTVRENVESFNRSHARYEDGEVHHRRSGRG